MFYEDYLKKMTKCPFCDAENRFFISKSHAYLTYAKSPYHPNHLLVVPKRHVISFFDLNKEEMKDVEQLIKAGSKILKKLKYTNFTILVREGTNTNKSIKHLHYHLIPNDRIGDLDHQGRKRVILSPAGIKTLSAKIFSVIKEINNK